MSMFYELMMKKKGIDYSKIPLTFTALENESKVGFFGANSAIYHLQYSTDNGATWQIFADSDTSTINTITLANVGDSVQIKGSIDNSNVASNYVNFVLNTGKVSASGNLYSILDENNYKNITDLSTYNNFCFARLFQNTSALINVDNLILQATKIGNQQYRRMFLNSGITKSPYLPATDILNSYQNMFQGCVNLTEIKIGYTGNFDTGFTDWVNGVSASGDFYYNGTDTTTGVSAIPTGWTVHTF